jgi:hypothetical protein
MAPAPSVRRSDAINFKMLKCALFSDMEEPPITKLSAKTVYSSELQHFHKRTGENKI